jgi:hypothetical protein
VSNDGYQDSKGSTYNLLGEVMTTYTVLVTGTAYIDVEASSPEEAEQLVPKVINDTRFGIWDMAMEFEAFNEGDE